MSNFLRFLFLFLIVFANAVQASPNDEDDLVPHSSALKPRVSYIQELPVDVLRIIFAQLNAAEGYEIRFMCKTFNHITSDPIFITSHPQYLKTPTLDAELLQNTAFLEAVIKQNSSKVPQLLERLHQYSWLLLTRDSVNIEEERDVLRYNHLRKFSISRGDTIFYDKRLHKRREAIKQWTDDAAKAKAYSKLVYFSQNSKDLKEAHTLCEQFQPKNAETILTRYIAQALTGVAREAREADVMQIKLRKTWTAELKRDSAQIEERHARRGWLQCTALVFSCVALAISVYTTFF